jgi:hypothetical protein
VSDSLQALLSIRGDQDFEVTARRCVREINKWGLKRFGPVEWNNIADRFAAENIVSLSMLMMSVDDCVKWITWAHENGYWHPDPSDLIEWAMRRRT